MNEIEKQKYFTLTDAVNTSVISTSRDIRDVKPIKDIEAPKYKTLTDAVRGFKFNQEVIDDIQKNLNEVPEATVGQKIKAGGESWLLSLRQTPESVRNLIYRHFQGMEYPNATSRQAFAIAEASAIRMNNEKALLQMRQTEEGTADSVIANLTSGALSVGEFALMGLATGGLGYALMGAQEAGDLSQEFVSKDIESGKIYEAGYKGQSLKEVIAADTYGAVAGWIEKGLGVEQSISEAWLSLAKKGAKEATKKSIGEAVVKGSIGEGLEEFLQGEASWTTGKIVSKEDKDFYEGFQDSLISGVYGAILGGAFGGVSTGLENGVARYYQARQDMASILMNKGIDQKEAVQIADNTLTSAVDFITTELEGRNSLQTYFGEDWDKLVDGVAQAYISQGWEQRFPDKDVREFAEMNAKAMVAPVIELSNRTNMPLKQILDLANFRQNENALFIDMPNVDDPKALGIEIKNRKAEIKRLRAMPATQATDTIKRLKEQVKVLELRLNNLTSYNAIEKARMDSRKATLDNQVLASSKPEIIADLNGIRQAQRGESFVYVGNNQVPVRYVVKPMAEVQASHIAGEANPNYTLKELQNRTRGTVTDDAILQNRAANLKPEELAESPNTQYGAPVVNKNGEVISGNGRMETLRRAYELGNTNYKEMLEKLGYNTEGIERPVLVRETLDDLTPEQQVAIAEASNVSETSAFDHARQAMNDAKLLKKGVSDPVTFADELPVSERQAYIRENGQYDLLALQRRFDDAVLAWIIGDTKTFDSLVLANRLNQKVIKGISMQGGNIVEFSKSNPNLGIKKDLRYALVKSASIKTRGHFIPAVQQQDIEEGITFNADALLYAMTFSNNSSELSNFIGQYVQTHQSYIDGQKDSFLSDSLPKLSKEDITNQVLLNNPLTASKFDKDGTCTDSNLKAVILNRIPVENVGYGTIKIEPEESQIKSTSNRGTYSESENIYLQSVLASKVDVTTKSEPDQMRKDAKKYMLDIVRKQNIEHPQLGKIRVSRKGINEFIKDTGNLDKIALISHLKELIETSEVGEREDLTHPREDGIVAFYPLYNDAIIDGKPYDVVTKIGVDRIGNLFYTILVDEKNSSESGGLDTKARVANETINMSISPTQENVNRLLQGKSINGYFEGELKTIVIGSSFNFGTLQHEFAHFFLKRVFDIYKTGAGTQEFNDWFSQLSSILDIKSDQFALTTPQQEQFARMTESYLFNKAEFPEGAKPAMQMFFDWCPAEYNELLSIGWKDDKGIYHNSVFNKESLDFFNDMYSLVPELGDSPLVRTFTNETNRNGTIIPADAEQRKEREKLIGETPVETVTTETTQASINIQNTPDPEVEGAYKEAIEDEQARKKSPVEKFTQYVRIGRGTNTREEMDELAQNYIKNHRENAERVAFGNPIPSGYEEETGSSLGYVENNTGIDRAVLILNLMNEYAPNSPEYNQLYHNFAIYRSYASKSAGLTNDVNTNYYLKGYVEINKALTQKAALVKYGKADNAVNLWNRDIDKFISQNIDKVYNTEPESAERDKAINQFIDDAKAMFGGDDSVLLQEEIRIKKAKDKQAFIDWANRVVKQIAKGKMPPMDEAKLMDLSVKAQKASKFIDSNNVDEAVAASQDIRAWQDFVNQKGLPESFVDKIIGTYLPSAMLSSPSTHALNAVSNFFNNVAIRAATRLHYGANVISGDVLNQEYNRLKAIYAESGHNLSEDQKPDDVSRLHGEHWQFKKPESALGYLSPMRLLGWSDFYFRAHTYVDTLARIASQDAKGDPKKALELFNEYKQMNSVNQRAKEARLQAIMTGHIAVFTNNGTLANISAGMRHYLDYINLVEIGKGGHKGLGTLIMPFAKVPANIVGMGIQAVSSPFKLLGKWTGLKKDWTIQDSIALTNFGLFSSIVGIYLMAGLDYEPPYEPPHKYDPEKPYDSIKIGGVWVSVESFGALANPLRFTFTMLDMISNGKKVEPSLIKAVEGLKNDIPFTSVEFDNDYMKRKPADWLVSATYNQLSKAVPAAVKKPIAWTNRALGLQIEQDSALKRKIARQYGLDGKQTTINDYLTYIYRGIKVDTK